MPENESRCKPRAGYNCPALIVFESRSTNTVQLDSSQHDLHNMLGLIHHTVELFTMLRVFSHAGGKKEYALNLQQLPHFSACFPRRSSLLSAFSERPVRFLSKLLALVA